MIAIDSMEFNYRVVIMKFYLQNRRWGTARQAEARRKELHVRLPAHDCVRARSARGKKADAGNVLVAEIFVVYSRT